MEDPKSTPNTDEFDTDWLIVGSGFGGSVSALRLSEAGERVTVFEAGRRFEDADFARSTWNLRRYFWAPLLGLRGIMRMTLFRDIFVATGAGVGGGSLGYANTLYIPHADTFYEDKQWADLGDWKRDLAPHYATAEHMLGVTDYGPPSSADLLMQRLATDLNVEDTWKQTRVGVFLGDSGVEVDDPYFGGDGPRRSGCIRCGECMVGCRYNAKNTLVKNYLWFAERAGAQIVPNREVVDIRPIGAADGSDGWLVTSEYPGWWVRRRRTTIRARGVILAAGALGTTRLLHRARLSGSLPALSDRVGHLVRTNSESILAVTAPAGSSDFSQTVAISSSMYPDPHTHIEPVTYGVGGGALGMLSTLLVGNGTRVTRPLKFLGQALRHPIRLAKITFPRSWSRRSFLLLVMQSQDNSIELRARRRRIGRGIRLRTVQDPDHPNPTFIPAANDAAERVAKYVDGIAQSSVMEALFNIPTTAHLLGGAVIGQDADHGVVDSSHRVFGYDNLMIVDGSTIPANVGVNPSLTITAMAERAMQLLVARRQHKEDPATNPVAKSPRDT